MARGPRAGGGVGVGAVGPGKMGEGSREINPQTPGSKGHFENNCRLLLYPKTPLKRQSYSNDFFWSLVGPLLANPAKLCEFMAL